MSRPAFAAPYSYELPLERIAQRPVHPYDAARMLVVNRESDLLSDSLFKSLPDYLSGSDTLVFNDSRVMPARIFGELVASGAGIEILLLEELDDNTWHCLARPLKKLRPGVQVLLQAGVIATALERRKQGILLQFEKTEEQQDGRSLRDILYDQGCMPIPPYIRSGAGDAEDVTDYQSLFAERDGSIAAPTASLHFTPELLKFCRDVGCAVETLTLHVGSASFQPLWSAESDVNISPPGSERYLFDAGLISTLQDRRAAGGRIIAVGTTVVRALESMVQSSGAGEESTDLFIYPGYNFQIVDALITNFHQPRTTHLLLVQAFIGGDLLERSYKHALKTDYRFLSYGDGMLLV